MNGVKEIQESDFQKDVRDADLPVVVDFYAPWCGPCRALAPVLEKTAGLYDGRIRFVKLNVDNAPRLASDFRIRGVPTLAIFRQGKMVDTLVGLPTGQALRAALDAVAAVPAEAAAN